MSGDSISHDEDNSFSPSNKSAVAVTVTFLGVIAAAEKPPACLRKDSHSCLALMTADLVNADELAFALKQVDTLKTADPSV